MNAAAQENNRLSLGNKPVMQCKREEGLESNKQRSLHPSQPTQMEEDNQPLCQTEAKK